MAQVFNTSIQYKDVVRLVMHRPRPVTFDASMWTDASLEVHHQDGTFSVIRFATDHVPASKGMPEIEFSIVNGEE